MKMKLLIVAPKGKMGKLITLVASQKEDIQIVGSLGPKGRDYIGTDTGIAAGIGTEVGAPVYDNIEECIDLCDVIIDFSMVEVSMEVLAAARAHKKALVCGTTGFSPEQRAMFDQAGEDIPVMQAGNTSKLVNLLYKLVEMTTKSIGEETDIEILDLHDRKKLDSPSGTAKEIGEVIGDALGKDVFEDAEYGREGRCPRKDGNIAFHSIRGGDISTTHTVFFIGTGERLELTHRAENWKCFASGAVDAAAFLLKQKPGSYSMADCLGF